MKYIKNYIIPTKNWLKLFNNNLIIDKIKKGAIIIKIINGNLLNNKLIYNIINGSQYIIKIYDFINEDNYTLEIMQKYNNTLNMYDKSLESTKNNLEFIEHILRYLLLIQLELFNNYGFIHNNIKSTNIIIIENYKFVDNIFYVHNNLNPQKIVSKYKLLLTDFEDSQILLRYINPNIINFYNNKSNIIFDNCLEYNIINTFYCCIELLKDNIIYNKILDEYNIDKKYPVKILSSYSRKEINELRFKETVLTNCISIISYLFENLFNKSFII